MVATAPGFKWRPIPRNYSVQRNIDTVSRGLILHVAVGGNFSLHGWFSNPAAKASSHWWAGYLKGQREQYVDPDNGRAWTQGAGNSMYHSIETAGNPTAPLTTAQVEACADLYAWGHKRYGWPFRLADRPGEAGLGWHGMGGAAWGGHVGCPGPLRLAQRPAILQLAQKIAGGSPAAPAPAPPTPRGLFDMAGIRIIRHRKHTAQHGKWSTVRLNDKGDLTLAIGPGNVMVTVQVAADIPPGGTLQGRFYQVDFKAGQTTKRTPGATLPPCLELTHTGGQTFGSATYLDPLSDGSPKGRSRRLRFELVAWTKEHKPIPVPRVEFRVMEG